MSTSKSEPSGPQSADSGRPVSYSTASQLNAAEDYHRQKQQCVDRLRQLSERHRRLTFLRMICFAVAAICLFFGYFGDAYQTLLLIVGWIAAACFFVAIVRHEHVRLERLREESDKKLFEHLLARIQRDWKQLPAGELLREFKSLAYADDLDIAGEASLLSLLSLARTFPGRRTLQSWLAEPGNWEDLRHRQSAVKRLVPHREFRIDALKLIRSTDGNSHEEYGLPNWAESPNWLEAHPGARLLSYIGPACVGLGTLVLVVIIATGNREWAGWGATLLGIGFLINIAVTVFWGSWIHELFHRVTGEHQACHQFARFFAAMKNLPVDDQPADLPSSNSPAMGTIKSTTSKSAGTELADTERADTELANTKPAGTDLLANIRYHSVIAPHSAERGFAKLMTTVRLANLQKDPMLYFVYLALQLLFVYDFRVLKRLESWKSQFGEHVVSWFSSLGTLEALMSCATLADENPDWCYAEEVDDVHAATNPSTTSASPTLLRAEKLGHPLLVESARVCNDLNLVGDQPLLLVTGSNMAGKSTFLRSIGLNILLSRAGAPVCANRFCLPIYELATSIRIRDSLSDGVSFFMAELKRLKEVVDLAEDQQALRSREPGAPRILFLLDEILQGTNSQERQIAVASVLEKLLSFGAAGMISTHDLDLAEAEEVKNVSQIVHFREYFEMVNGKEVMRFDYVMRPGSTPTTNALKLLKLVGLR